METAVMFTVICLSALSIAGLTFFSGFGLGTLLMPVFALFFELPTAIAATAVVHLANNLFKAGLVYREADLRVALRFGAPSALAAVAGAALLVWFSSAEPLHSYHVGGQTGEITPVKLAVSFLILVFAGMEVHPRSDKLAFNPKWLPLGGVISGFFGGVSGHQGALRGAFLIKTGLSKESFVATSALCAIVVDVVRLAVYGAAHLSGGFAAMEEGRACLIVTACLAAFGGTYFGRKLLDKVTLKTVQGIVAVMLFLVAVLLAAGLV